MTSECWDVTFEGVTMLESTCYFFSRNFHILLLHYHSSLLFTYLNASPCVSIINRKHRYKYFKFSLDNSAMNWVWAITGPKLVWDTWCVGKTQQTTHSFQISKLSCCVSLKQQKDLCLSHIISIFSLHFWIKLAYWFLNVISSIRILILLDQVIAQLSAPLPSISYR
jgi:hypothetical protein